MADAKTEQEPSIEEILESIRQIISEDGEAPAQAAPEPPKPAAAAPPPPPPPAPKPAPVPPPAPADDILDLTEKVAATQAIDLQDIPPQTYNSDLDLSSDNLVSGLTADISAHAMARLLAGNVAVEREVQGRVGSVTLEDMARELMKPLIKSWLDQNLPAVIEKMVAKEIERISRLAMKQ